MPDLKALSRGTLIILGAGLLLLIDTFLAWQKASVEIAGVEFSGSRNAWHGFWGVVMGLALIGLLAWIGLRIANVNLNVNVPERPLIGGLAGIVFVFAVLKNLIDDYSAWPSYVGIVLAGAVLVGAWLHLREPEVAAAGMPPAGPAPPPAAPPPEPEAPPPRSEPGP